MARKKKAKRKSDQEKKKRRAELYLSGIGGDLSGVQYGRRKWFNSRRRKKRNTSYRWLGRKQMQKWEKLAKQRGVSKVARSPRGFLAAYKRAGYKASNLSDKWKRKRSAFIKRHLAQVKKRREKLWKNGKPTKRLIALRIWAYGGS